MDQELIADLYRQMYRIRRFEEEAARLYTERKIGGFLHLYIGQEAVAVGSISVLDLKKDYVMTAYRCHGHYLACGGSSKGGMAELLGKETGCAQGRGGSMHFFDIENHFMGGWGIVGAQTPVAAGIAFAQKYQNTDGVTICFGDGAINIGPFHEAMCLASLWNLPVIFIVENNQFAMGTPLSKSAAVEDVSIRAMGYPMARDTMDGLDVFSVRSVMHAAIKRAREQKLPTLIDAKTYRFRGHSMADPGTYRTKEEVEEKKKLDPVHTLGVKLESLGMLAIKKEIDAAIDQEMQDAVKFAEDSKFPDPSTATQWTYCDDTPLL